MDAVEYCLQQGLKDGMTPEEQAKRLPFRLIHAQMATPELIERMKKLPLVLDIQPTFLMTDLHWIEDRVGKERAEENLRAALAAFFGIEGEIGLCDIEENQIAEAFQSRRDPSGYGRISRGRLSSRREDIRV